MQEDGGSQIHGGLATASPEDVAPPVFEAPPRHAESKGSLHSSSSSCALPAVPQFPPPKTDKPRPHVCTTCMRSFARLEHLKRHERSHTKEKPFSCSECTRCFARRDLLLRHQQKLHSSITPSSRPRNTRRESVAGVGTGRVRKNSVASNAPATMRPRANTLSHVDASTIGMLANTSHNFNRPPVPGHSHHSSLSGLHGPQGFSYRGISASNHASPIGLHKLETHDLATDLLSGLRTAPPYSGFGSDFGTGFHQGLENTINPHALHMDGLNDQSSVYQQMFLLTGPLTDDDGTFDWMTQGFENQMTFHASNENAIDDSSPSAMSTNSPSAQHDLGSDWQSGSAQSQNLTNGTVWPSGIPNSANMINSPMSIDFGSSFAELAAGATGTISPKSLVTQAWPGLDMNLPTPPEISHLDPTAVQHQGFQLSHSRTSAPSTTSTTSVDSSLQHSSVTTMSSDLVNEGVRNVLIAGLAQNNPFVKKKYSQPLISSPLSPDGVSRSRGFNVATFPSTQDLQKYVAAYIKYFHPHLPFLHIPTLDFESPDYTTPSRGYGISLQGPQGNVANGGSCLILSIAAIGAVYEKQMDESRELFECAKRLISGYLEERHKANLNRTRFGPRTPADSEDTPLWLVQAMLLNVIYGHNCGDRTTAELASNHCAALVSLARGAELARPYGPYAARRASNQNQQFAYDDPNAWTAMINENEEVDWLEWKIMEERKRTLYAVFILSSMLVTVYNHAPALTNSEIRLDLPCDEELWAAENSQSWLTLGGARQADSKAVTFATALTHLLMSSQRQRRRSQSTSQSHSSSDSDLKPSAFGCLVLVNALHNYIWETRQRHLSRQWTAQETEQMHQHIEPALRAWQAAWISDPSRSLERSNPVGGGALSADSIPLLDLAYVRLYINLGMSKEAFWQREFDSMAADLARGPETTQSVEVKRDDSALQPRGMSGRQVDEQETDIATVDKSESGTQPRCTATQRERQLRRAASHAADSLLLAAKLGLSYLEAPSHELPAQSAMCAFDCAQVLAEWVTVVQERVGRRIGLIGRDEIDFMQMPATLLLEDKDREILETCDKFLKHAQERLGSEANVEHFIDGGYGPRLLAMTAEILERAAVWPGNERWRVLVKLIDEDYEDGDTA
ncbi:hypothetical protein DV736_g4309, partial [Chaetothyriales sp. CBS 134916]